MSRQIQRLIGISLTIAVLLSVYLTVAPAVQASNPAAFSPCDIKNSVWIGTFGYGINCLDSAGWHEYTTDNKSGLKGNLFKTIAACPDNRVWVNDVLGLSVSDGKSWRSIKTDSSAVGSIEMLACDGEKGIWLAHYRGVSHYDGKKWTTYEAKALGTGESVDLVRAVQVAPDGKIWAITPNSVAVFDGKAWSYYEDGKGFDNKLFFETLAIDGQGRVWAGHGNGIVMFDGETWMPFEEDALSQIQSMTIDATGNVWVGTYSKGLSKYDGDAWITYDRSNSDLPSNHVSTLASDAQGRIWIGTEWGLSVLDGENWITYQMHTSDLLDNEIYALAVTGEGPTLPELVSKKPGAIVGTVVRGSTPVDSAVIQICTENVGMMFSGESPCADNPYTKTVTTESDGKFAVDGLPVGRYDIALKDPSPQGGWIDVTGGIGGKKVGVESGKDTDTGNIDISSNKQ